MSDLTLFKPSGQAEYKNVTNVEVKGDTISFYVETNASQKTGQRITTSVPFFLAENVGS
jgi:hypothetical protein